MFNQVTKINDTRTVRSRERKVNAPAWNWNGRKEQLSKPLTAETLCEFIARVAVHEGTHEESGKDYRALAPSEQQKWDADPTRFEQKPYDREIEQIDQQRKNRNGN